MSDFLAFTILGLATGAIYAIAASGLVVTYTTSGIFNFAHGAVGMLGAFAYWQLRVEWGWPAPLALLVVLGILAPALGLLIERVIIRGLYDTSETTKLVVSVGLLVAFIGLAQVLWELGGRRTDRFFGPDAGFSIGDVFVSWHQVITMLAAAGVAFGLWLFLNRTRTGISIRAVVDNRTLAQLNGARPNRASGLSWAIGFSLAALAGVLIAPVLQLRIIVLTFLVVNAYAAAMFGRLRSLPMTFVGGLALGIIEGHLVGWLNPNRFSFLEPFEEPIRVLGPAIPVIVLFVVLLVLPQERARSHAVVRVHEQLSRPTWRGTAIAGAVFFAVMMLLIVLLKDDPTNLSHLSRALALGVVLLSLVPLTGYGGQISLAQMGLAGIGAVVVSKWQIGGPMEDLLALAAAIVITGVVGALVALPALRLRGVFLALATFAFAVFLDRVIFQLGITYTGNAVDVERFELFGISLESDQAYATFLVLVVLGVSAAVVALRRGPFGRRLQAMKDSPSACATLGIDLTRTKLQVFMLSAAIAGLGGALLGAQRETVSPETFEATQSLIALLMAAAGGIGFVSGALLGGGLWGSFQFWVEVVPEEVKGFVQNVVLLAPGLIGISLARNPNGLVHQFILGFRRRWKGAHVEEESAEPDGRDAQLELEVVGLDQPITPDLVEELDVHLDIDGVTAVWAKRSPGRNGGNRAAKDAALATFGSERS